MPDTVIVSKLTPMVGAEVLGVDLTKPLDNSTLAAIRQAFVDNGVIFFRDQPMTVDQHKAFARLFGKLFVHPASNNDLIRIHADENSKKVAGEEWHTDTSCEAAPPLGSVLHLSVVPPVGGDTLFSSMYAAYEALSEPMKAQLETMTAHHSAEAAYQGFYGGTQKNSPKADHPVICVHPESGRKYLFVNRFYTTKINGLTPRESAALLDFLFQHIESPEFHCRFRWRPNSVAFWDNRCTQHKAVFDYFPQKRSGYRVQIEGDAPVGVH